MYFPPLKVMIVVVNHKNAGQICRNVKETKCSQCVKKKKKGACAFQKTFFGLDTDFLFLSLSLSDRGGERSGQIVGELVHRGTLKRFETNHSPFATRCQF